MFFQFTEHILTWLYVSAFIRISSSATALKANYVVFRCTSSTIQARIGSTRITYNRIRARFLKLIESSSICNKGNLERDGDFGYLLINVVFSRLYLPFFLMSFSFDWEHTVVSSKRGHVTEKHVLSGRKHDILGNQTFEVLEPLTKLSHQSWKAFKFGDRVFNKLIPPNLQIRHSSVQGFQKWGDWDGDYWDII